AAPTAGRRPSPAHAVTPAGGRNDLHETKIRSKASSTLSANRAAIPAYLLASCSLSVENDSENEDLAHRRAGRERSGSPGAALRRQNARNAPKARVSAHRRPRADK